MILLRLALRGLAAHRLRLALTAVAVVLGVAFTSGTLILTDTMERSFTRMFEGVNADVDAVVRTEQAFSQQAGPAFGAGPGLPADLAEELAEPEEVESVHPVAEGTAVLLGPGGEEVGGQGPPQIGTTWHGRPGSGITLTAGRGPEGAGEFALDEGTAADQGLEPGDRAVLRFPDPGGGPVDGSDGGAADEREMELTGVFRAGEVGMAAGATVAAFEPETARRLLLGDPDRVTEFHLVGDDAKSQWQIADSVAPVLPLGAESLPMDIVRDEETGPLLEVLGFFEVFLLTFAGIALFTASFLIANTFAVLVARRVRELALLRAVGASQAQVRAVVMGEALGVGLVGSALGLAAGAALARGVLAAMGAAGVGLPEVPLRLTGTSAAIAVAVGVGVTLAAAYVPVRRGTRVPPVAAMRDDTGATTAPVTGAGRVAAGSAAAVAGAAATTGGVLLAGGDAAPWLVGAGAALVLLALAALAPVLGRPVLHAVGAPLPRLWGLPGRLGRDNALRSPRRTAATAMALTVGLGLVAAVATLSASAEESVDRRIDEAMGADLAVVAEGFDRSVPPQVVDEVDGAPGVAAVAAVRVGQLEVAGAPSMASSGDPGRLARAASLDVVEGGADFSEAGMMVAQDVADERGWRVGRDVPVVFPDGTEAELPLEGVYAAGSMVASDHLISPEAYTEYFDEDLVAAVYVTAEPGAADRARAAVDTALEDAPGAEVLDRGEMKERNRESLARLTGTISAMLVLSVVIAGLGIANTLALSASERVREIGLLRAVGLSRVGLRRMIRLEAVVIAVFGALPGLGVGLLFAWALHKVLEDDGIVVFAVPAGTLAALLGASVVIGVLASLWPAWRASRLDVLKAIATE
ncbi:ABC transporter permease [Nocardiopsis suaedae]|uniref:ABC transporter permease n=1 Tax=Nocardiopsis suaedae TaxID=3018444 RepID=A0ABT4TVP8_9ACTN|nr:ABC transporter permease [Nocardiopsis suaedae]MDA2808747.1 ABC transporter permease [Nocardiopsis suaedae]